MADIKLNFAPIDTKDNNYLPVTVYGVGYDESLNERLRVINLIYIHELFELQRSIVDKYEHLLQTEHAEEAQAIARRYGANTPDEVQRLLNKSDLYYT